jgi:hypothetical protein
MEYRIMILLIKTWFNLKGLLLLYLLYFQNSIPLSNVQIQKYRIYETHVMTE